MNTDQIQMVVRTILTIAGSMLVSKGIISANDLTTLTTLSLAFVGGAFALGSFAWSLYAHSQNAKIASVNAIPGVMVTTTTSPAKTLVTEAPKL
jgi:hypothetical protein